ncbi:FG-GAP repeat protein [Stieleria maiorica]|uniref:FG-GAP repeat protein n=1 Tax=Stieleria maiorica TaxID=2795974 RepID=A0A5B9MFX6_9BACT|nr:FG-GAP-like repeat-containing protein [Stieleria maiorica]QEG00152.1 FG-GAP repeat protein [Stieleria maiorica]
MLTASIESDNDGVQFGEFRIGQLDAFATIEVVGGPAKLDAWIDFNRDGSLSGQGEQIADSVDVNNGLNLIQFDVPPNAVAGEVQARFRISTLGDLGVSGPAPDGEVEDYLVQISPNVLSSGVFSSIKDVTLEADSARNVFAADIDSDGDMDLVGASDLDDAFAWYENNGEEEFVRHVISSVSDGAWDSLAIDLDGDGDVDILGASREDDTVAWFENDGNEQFSRRVISDSVDNVLTITTADMDGDGDLDVIAGGREANTIYLYTNDGQQSFAESVVSSSANGVETVEVADLDGDGDLDVLASLVFANALVWLENDGDLGFTLRTIDSNTAGASFITAADLDGDGDLDVIGTGTYDDKLQWFENQANGTFAARQIDSGTGPLTTSVPFDVDGDGDIDIAVSSPREGGIAWYRNDGSQQFSRMEISKDASFVWHIDATDLDGDGDLDLISSSLQDDRVAWFENLNFDFGNAGSPYPTLLADDGPRHVPIGPRLGQRRDDEVDAIQAFGQDNDGVTVPVSLLTFEMEDSGSSLLVDSSEPGFVDAWIDFDGDGRFSAESEKIARRFPVSAGKNVVGISIPSGLPSGDATLRIRISSDGDLGPNGVAADGEVEDHAIRISDLPNLAVRSNAGLESPDLHFEGNSLVVRLDDAVLFRGPSGSLASFAIEPFDPNFQLGIDLPTFSEVVGLLDRIGQHPLRSIQLTGGSGSIALNEMLKSEILQPAKLDLGEFNAISLHIQGSDFDASSGETVIEVSGESDDSLVFGDPSNWQFEAELQNGVLSRNVRMANGNGVIVLQQDWKAWQNPLRSSDVTDDGEISPLDALLIINTIARSAYVNTGTNQLVSPTTLVDWPGIYVDQNGDGLISPLDALRVINEIARIEYDTFSMVDFLRSPSGLSERTSVEPEHEVRITQESIGQTSQEAGEAAGQTWLSLVDEAYAAESTSHDDGGESLQNWLGGEDLKQILSSDH